MNRGGTSAPLEEVLGRFEVRVGSAIGGIALGETHKPEPISPSLTPSDFDAVYLWDVFSFFGKTI